MNIKNPIDQAINLLLSASTAQGFVASTEDQDNYKRIWARDGIITGLAGILSGDERLIETLGKTIQTLSSHQLSKGTIPSNVAIDGNHVSYGSAAGRVDATSWYLVGCCLFLLEQNNDELKSRYKDSLDKAIAILDAWEYNDKHLIYTPVSGNWADEYPIQGYLLYDNCLRYWGLSLYSKIFGGYEQKLNDIESTILNNFWFKKVPSNKPYFQPVYEKRFAQGPSKFFEAGFSPSGYTQRFDAAGNGLALMLFGNKIDECDLVIESYVNELNSALGKYLIPAFWPVISKDDPEWRDLELNYAFDFKNHPGHFHNGGIWPVMMGLFCMGLSNVGLTSLVEKVWGCYYELVQEDFNSFYEYVDSNDFIPRGKRSMAFTASGIVFMQSALNNSEKVKSLIV